MKKRVTLLLIVILMHGDVGRQQISNGYQDVEHLHIQWQELLVLPYHDYEVLVYSLSCSYCLKLENKIVKRALSSNQVPLFFVEVNRELPFGASSDLHESLCELSQIKIAGYPLLIVIKEGCSSFRILGYQAIMEHYTICD